MGKPPDRQPTRRNQLKSSIGPNGIALSPRCRIVQVAPIHKDLAVVRWALCDVGSCIGGKALNAPGGDTDLIYAAFHQKFGTSAVLHWMNV